MRQLLRRFARDDQGGTVIEYALIASGLAIATIAAVQVLSTETNTTFNNVAGSFAGANAAAP